MSHLYPQVPAELQNTLPRLVTAAEPLAVKFTDSTHQLWLCQSRDELMVLKTCNRNNVRTSTFWQGINGLFSADFPANLLAAPQLYAFVAEHGHFSLPRCLAAAPNHFVLSTFTAGVDLEQTDQISPGDVRNLAQHLAALHQQTYSVWGAFHQPDLPAALWPEKLARTLNQLSESSRLTIPAPVLHKALTQAQQIRPAEFAVIMPDLRWDQLRRMPDGKLTLLDMDAFVIGPRELELVLVEYLLTPEQLQQFKHQYQRHLRWPDLSGVRYCYRLLLFLMNVLGDTDLKQWLNHPCC